MAKTLYYLRHGETVFNLKGVWQGRADSPLSELGERQARAAGEHLRALGVDFDRVVRSPLGRVAQTLEVADARLAERAEALDGLVEMSFGDIDGTPHERDPRSYDWTYFATIGGESPDEVTARTCATLESVMLQADCGSVLAAGHGTTARLFCERWASNSTVDLGGFVPNCAVLTFAFDEMSRSFSLEDVWAPSV